tara:strand:+ start:4659 stop:6176 length:1518 start_codon:yes stop_codon:yes gene_type:complete
MSDDATDEWVPISYPIPKHWEHGTFDECFGTLPTSGFKIRQKDYSQSGRYPVIDQGADFIGGYTDDKTKVFDLSEPVLVFGDHTKCFKFVTTAFAPGADGIHILTPRGHDAKYLYHLYHSLRLPDRGYSRHFSFLKRSKFPIAPLNEQRRIVEKIENLFAELDKGEESLRVAKAQAVLYRQSLLKHAFEGHLTADWRATNPDKLEDPETLLARIQKERDARYKQALDDWEAAVSTWRNEGEEGRKPVKPKRPREFDTSLEDIEITLCELPHGWFWQRLGLCTIGVEYGTSTRSDEIGKVPVIRMGNLQNGRIDWSDLVYTSSANDIAKYSLRRGDVLFNRTNSPELVGKTAFFVGDREALFAGYLIRVNQIEAIALGKYVMFFLNSIIAKSHGNMVKTDGVNQSNINGNKLQEYPFPYCSPKEQAEIVDRLEAKLSNLDALVAEIDTQIKHSKALRQSILKRAFSGKLVPQDPTDEPAAKLLERIMAERTAAHSPKAKRRKKANA